MAYSCPILPFYCLSFTNHASLVLPLHQENDASLKALIYLFKSSHLLKFNLNQLKSLISAISVNDLT